MTDDEAMAAFRAAAPVRYGDAMWRIGGVVIDGRERQYVLLRRDESARVPACVIEPDGAVETKR